MVHSLKPNTVQAILTRVESPELPSTCGHCRLIRIPGTVAHGGAQALAGSLAGAVSGALAGAIAGAAAGDLVGVNAFIVP